MVTHQLGNASDRLVSAHNHRHRQHDWTDPVLGPRGVAGLVDSLLGRADGNWDNFDEYGHLLALGRCVDVFVPHMVRAECLGVWVDQFCIAIAHFSGHGPDSSSQHWGFTYSCGLAIFGNWADYGRQFVTVGSSAVGYAPTDRVCILNRVSESVQCATASDATEVPLIDSPGIGSGTGSETGCFNKISSQFDRSFDSFVK